MEPERLASSERQRARADSVRQLISQKRDVSYVQLALDLKRRQIQRLEAFVARRAATLQKAEDELDADAAQFDDFLRRNDEEVQAAVRQADEQASIRQDKVVAPVHGWAAAFVGRCRLADGSARCWRLLCMKHGAHAPSLAGSGCEDQAAERASGQHQERHQPSGGPARGVRLLQGLPGAAHPEGLAGGGPRLLSMTLTSSGDQKSIR